MSKAAVDDEITSTWEINTRPLIKGFHVSPKSIRERFGLSKVVSSQGRMTSVIEYVLACSSVKIFFDESRSIPHPKETR